LEEYQKSQWFSWGQILTHQAELAHHLQSQIIPQIPAYQKNTLNLLSSLPAVQVFPQLQGSSFNWNYDTFSKLLSPFGNNWLTAYPLLSKQQIQSCLSNYIYTPHKEPWSYETTSGSSGTPFTFPVTRTFAAHFRAALYRGHQWAGDLPIGAKEARIYGLPVSSSARNKEFLKDFLMNRIRLSVLDLSDRALESFTQQLIKWNPHYLYGYVSGLISLTHFLIKKGRKPPQGLKSLIATSEVLHDFEKSILENYWQVRCYNEYGASELGILASECSAGSLHWNFEANLLELENTTIHQDGQVSGEAIITNFTNERMPLLRYQLGDRLSVLPSLCKCGRRSPCISISEGRLNNMVITPEGKKVSGWLFYYIYRDLLQLNPGQSRFQAIQTKPNQIDIYMSISADFYTQAVTLFKKHCLLHLGPAIQLKFHNTSELPQTGMSGKYMPFISQLKQIDLKSL